MVGDDGMKHVWLVWEYTGDGPDLVDVYDDEEIASTVAVRLSRLERRERVYGFARFASAPLYDRYGVTKRVLHESS